MGAGSLEFAPRFWRSLTTYWWVRHIEYYAGSFVSFSEQAGD